ncbi:dihydroneopterin aldolase [Fodinibius salinus]|uniref:7,8-dihydroneopterin aldolase n=1 Tax=Fodinibius salinus TaxID=860790 RepID=A0A5D3YPJ5_9BACT|nr:dihydroneopterin aldolase [Fodinibius salinus]TYP94099.1 dihydroneopterin aldolase [Fodinibius salinus]
METLTLKGLHFHALHGYYEEERKNGNNFEVDLIFSAHLREAGSSDELDKTIDYQQAEKIVHSVMEGPSVKLIETLAKKIGDKLFATFDQTHQLEVKVRKISPPLQTKTDHSEICMTWQRQ